MRTTLQMKLVAAVAMLAVVAGACGGDDDEDTGADASAAATTVAETAAAATTVAGAGAGVASGALPKATGEQSAKVMVLTDVTQGQIAYSAPETYPAVQAALSEFPNVEITVCDAKGDQNEYLNCQRQAVDDGVAAVVVGWSAGGAGGEDILYEAGIPVIGGGSATAPLSYAFASGTGNYVGLGAGSVVGGCSKLGILHLEGTDFLADMVKLGAESQGGQEVSRAAVPSNAPDLAPAIAKLLGDGSDCIILSVSPPMVVQAMTAISQSGETPKAAAVGAILPPPIIEALGPLSEGLISIEPALSSADGAKVLTDLQSAMGEYDGDAPITVQSTVGFVGGHVLATALSQIDGEVTPAAVVEQLNTIKDLDAGGIVPPVTIQELDNPMLTRFMNPWAIAYAIEDGTPVRITEDFVDLKPAIEGAG